MPNETINLGVKRSPGEKRARPLQMLSERAPGQVKVVGRPPTSTRPLGSGKTQS